MLCYLELLPLPCAASLSSWSLCLYVPWFLLPASCFFFFLNLSDISLSIKFSPKSFLTNPSSPCGSWIGCYSYGIHSTPSFYPNLYTPLCVFPYYLSAFHTRLQISGGQGLRIMHHCIITPPSTHWFFNLQILAQLLLCASNTSGIWMKNKTEVVLVLQNLMFCE